MKQLFIIPTANGAYPTSTTLLKGQLMFYKSDAPNTVVSTAPAATDKEICFAYSRGENSSLITGVIDLNSLTVIKMSKAGKATTPAYGKGKWVIVCPTPEKGLNYTITLAKKGVVFNERNLFSVTDTYRAKVKTAADLAKSLADQLNKLAPGLINIKATVTDTNNVTIQGQGILQYKNVYGGMANARYENKIVERLNENDPSFFRMFNSMADRDDCNLAMFLGNNGIATFHSVYNFDTKDLIDWS